MKFPDSIILKYLGLILFLLFAELLISQENNTLQIHNTPENLKVNTIGLSNILFSGVLLKNNKSSHVSYIPNIFELLPANTIEGFVINPQVKFSRNYNDNRFFSLTPNIRYGFGNKELYAQIKSNYFYSPKSNGQFIGSIGYTIEQLYEDNTLSALNNTLYTFILNENFLKIYQRSYIEFGHIFSPLKNFLLTTSINWNDRKPLNNLTRFEQNENFTSNAPKNIELENTSFENNQAVIFNVKLLWQIGHHLIKKKGNLVSKGKYPALTLSYTNATDKILGGDISYQKLAISVHKEFKTGLSYGQGFVEFGDFLKIDNITFLDFKHFKGNQTVYSSYTKDQFQLLNFYKFSTSELFIQAHYQHHFSLSRNKNKYKLQPVVGLHYLFTETAGHYIELGFGINKILKLWRIDIYKSWREWNQENFGIRLGIRLE